VPEQRDVKVFISWSGDLAKAVAIALREWLPLLFDRVAPWASDTDIEAGQRGLNEIEAELAGTQFGVVVVTAENQDAPWLNFEAGALSKTIVGDLDRRVVPLLVDLSGASQLTGPLRQFQAKRADREGIHALLRSLAEVAGIDPAVVDARFAAYWASLEEKIREALATAPSSPAEVKAPRPEGDVLDEILVHVRALRSESEPLEDPWETDESRRLEAFVRNMGFKVAAMTQIGSKVASITIAPIGEYDEDLAQAAVGAVRKVFPSVRVDATPF
jgi:hypothetical protein